MLTRIDSLVQLEIDQLCVKFDLFEIEDNHFYGNQRIDPLFNLDRPLVSSIHKLCRNHLNASLLNLNTLGGR